MKKLIVFTVFVCFIGQVFGGGVITNGNQSAQYIRMLSRNASTSVDAVYFNPAGLMLMDNGFYISLQNQTLFQTKTVQSGFPLLNTGRYDGALTVPVFPTGFAVFKKDRFAISFGFGPVNGGGSAEYKTGLPSFEKDISKLVPGLAGLSKLGKKVSGYSADIAFKGESVYWGIQGGASVKVNNIFSVYAGLRYVPATNIYTGHINNISLNVNGTVKNAGTFLTSEVVPVLQASATNANNAALSAQQLIDLNAGAYTLAQLQLGGKITVAQRTQFEQGLIQIAGLTQTQVDQMNVTQIKAAFSAGASALTTQATALDATGKSLNDKTVDVKQTGTGYTPIFGLSIKPNSDWNIGLKYEFKTSLTLTNATTADGTGKLFPDGKKTGSDIPSLLSIGTEYKLSKKVKLSLSFNSYHDKGVDWGTNIYGEPRTIDNNTWEVAIGGQYSLTDAFALSAGYLHTEMGVSKQFQSDFSYYNPGDTFGGGLEWKANSRFTVDAGMLCTFYTDVSKTFKDASLGSYIETYKKHNLGFALGLCYRFGGM